MSAKEIKAQKRKVVIFSVNANKSMHWKDTTQRNRLKMTTELVVGKVKCKSLEEHFKMWKDCAFRLLHRYL